ncbi:hypothetical protein [Virgibacillus sp. DJP39]|uniref:Cap15 family cyclic dinucleotide receptor domain-containing protein n=1 Tax=Virgibacillus sp. DJP39 TaxID=3409790 RepID=UPI003BB62867
MTEEVKRHLKIAFYACIALFTFCIFILKPNSLRDYSSYAGLAVFLTTIISVLYEKWVWRFNPIEKTPKLFKHYNGTIEYSYNGSVEHKNLKIYVRQSLFNLDIKLVTEEIISTTITSKIVKENGNYVLYYTYITNPKSKFSDTNPIQYGTSRFLLDETEVLQGVYWTSRKTKGDIYLDYKIGYKDEKFNHKLLEDKKVD